METEFDKFLFMVLQEAGGKPAAAPQAGQEESPTGEEGNSAEDGNNIPDEGGDDDFNPEDIDLDDVDEEPALPEELELGKLAVRALYFNPDSKSVHRYKLNVNGERIPFERISDYFEETKNWKPVLGFVEHIMDKFEGMSSKWTEQPEIKGKGILDKIKQFNDNVPEEERLDNGKRVYWARIILNCLLYGRPTYNMTIDDVNDQSIKEIYRKLKQDFGRDSRGLLPDIGLKGAGVF